MTTSRAQPCDVVAERVALGEPLADVSAHAASCERCQRLLQLPASLASAARAVDPGAGFSARVTAGAQNRLVARRQRRIAGASLVSIAVAAVAVLVVTHHPAPPAPTAPAGAPAASAHEPEKHEPRKVDPDVSALIHLADTAHDLSPAANWGRIEKPLRPYQAVLEGKLP